MSESTAVSVYDAGNAMDDFPVLKAFQQYIDAEQAKAQKRMTTVCFFFAVILFLVVGVFVALLMVGSHRNDALNDQLLQLMINNAKDHSAVVVQGPAPQNDAAIKALSDSMAALQQQLADQQKKILEQQQKLVEEKTKQAEEAKAAAVKPQSPSREQLAVERKLKEDAEKIRKATALLQAEKDRVAKEKDRLKQKEIELQRRKLYPELYDENGNRKRYVPLEDLEDDEDDENVEDLDDLDDLDRYFPPARKRADKPAKKKSVDKFDGPIKYFDDWDIPLE